MKLNFSSALSIIPVNNDTNKTNMVNYINNLIGGEEYPLPVDYDESLSLQNVFEVDEVEYKTFQVKNPNVLSVSIFDILETNVENISFIHVFCKEIKGTAQEMPVFFDVLINDVKVFRGSQFSLMNIRDLTMDSLTVENIKIPATQVNSVIPVAGLFIIVGSRDKYIS